MLHSFVKNISQFFSNTFFSYICMTLFKKNYTMERAMCYENLIKAVFKCERGEHGAEADIYRGLYPFGKLRDDVFKRGVYVGIISVHLSNALSKAISMKKDKSDFVSKIQKCVMYLNNPTAEKLNNCIDEAWIAFSEIDLIV